MCAFYKQFNGRVHAWGLCCCYLKNIDGEIVHLLVINMYTVAGAHSGRFPAATFQGTVSVLAIVIALQAVVIVIMIVAVCRHKFKV